MYSRAGAELTSWLATTAEEEALEPELEIVDAHHHLWDRAHPGSYLLPELLADVGSGHKVVSTVYVESGSMYRNEGDPRYAPLGEIEFANGIAAMSASGRYGPCRVAEAIVGRADLALGPSVRDVLEAGIAVSGGRLRGIRHGLAWDPSPAISQSRQGGVSDLPPRFATPHLALDPAFREGFAQLAPLGLVFDCFVFHSQFDEAIDLARTFPETTVALNHVGIALGVGPYASRRREAFAEWSDGIDSLARLPNVNVKLGGMGMPLFGFALPESEKPLSSERLATIWRPYIERCIEAFGADRCMFESNFPPDNQAGTYRTLWNAFKRTTSSASKSEKAALYSATARRVYRLPERIEASEAGAD